MGAGKKEFGFAGRAAVYDEGFEGKLSRRFYELLQGMVQVEAGMRLLDVGCGTGALLRRLCEGRDIEGFGIDVEENMLAEARKKCPDCTFIKASSEGMPFPDSHFDALTACMAYHHFSDKPGFSREAARVLRPGGALHIADPRFPFVIRKGLNGTLRLFRVAGEFYTAQEIADSFSKYGFQFAGERRNGYAQVVMLTRTESERVK